MASDPWDTLGVPRTASPDELRAAYRRLARELHPDRFATADAGQRRAAELRLQEVGEAYQRALEASRGAGFNPPSAPPGARGGAGAGEYDSAGEYERWVPGPVATAPDRRVGCLPAMGAVAVAFFVAVLIITAVGVDFDREPGRSGVSPPWDEPAVPTAVAPAAAAAWHGSDGQECPLLVPTGLVAGGSPRADDAVEGWAVLWGPVRVAADAGTTVLPEVGEDAVGLLWSDGTEGVAAVHPAGNRWTATFVRPGIDCRYHVRVPGAFADLARVLGTLREVEGAGAHPTAAADSPAHTSFRWDRKRV